ncbi:MAG: hypothetical protein MUF15_13185, partial [Acidobacteria bacterium]|nr:hypothetical protein [Acidobacteriota bacterium]
MKIKILATDELSQHGQTRTIFFENSHQGTKAPSYTKGLYYKKRINWCVVFHGQASQHGQTWTIIFSS